MKVNLSAGCILSRPERHVLSSGEISKQSNNQHYRLLFVSAGGHTLLCKDIEEERDDRAVVYLIPSDLPISIQACEDGVELLVLQFKASTMLCGGHCPERRDPQSPVSQSSGEDKNSHYRPRRHNTSHPGKLALSESLLLWLEGLKVLMNHPNCEYRYYDHRIEEFFYLIRQEYAREETNAFLSRYHCRIMGFREGVMSKYRANMEVSDLYAIGEALGLSEATFKRSFIEEFGVSPREWIIERRAQLIYQDLITTDSNFKELSSKYGFCNVSYFGAFCRQALGDTPLRIRKRVQG